MLHTGTLSAEWRFRLRFGGGLLLLVLGWLLLGKVIAPWLITSVPPLTDWLAARWPIEAYLSLVDNLVQKVTTAIVVFAVVGYTISRGWFYERFVKAGTPLDLAAIRIFVLAWMTGSAIWENPASTAILPRELSTPLGVIGILYRLPIGFDLFAHNAVALAIFKWVTVALLLMGTIGYRTRLVLPLAAVCYLILGGLMRQYTWYWHQGLIPLYVLIVLCFVPCNHSLSVDSWLRRRRGLPVQPDRPSPLYGWARWACWVPIALSYFAAGTNKVRIGGWEWFNANSMRFFVYRDTLNHSGFPWHLGLDLTWMPDAFFQGLTMSAVFGEAGYILALFFPWARWIFPPLTSGMHIGITALQHILFLDLILIQAIFIDWRRVLAFLRRAPAVAAIVPALPPLSRPYAALPTARVHRLAGLFVAAITAVMATAYIYRIEYFPLTAVQMYTTPRLTETVIPYYRVWAHTESGAVISGEQLMAETIPAMADGRSRRVIARCFSKQKRPICTDVLRSSAAIYNRTAPPGQRIARFDVQWWEWDFATQPASHQPGSLIQTVTLATP